MPAITVTDLNNAKTDVDHIAAVATSQAGTATDRLGGVKLTLYAALARLGYSVPVVYTSGLSMTVGTQTVERSGVVYAPILSQLPFVTSGTFESAKFRVLQGLTDADLAAPGASRDVGHIASNPSAVATTVGDKIDTMVTSPVDSGAVGNRSTNDLTAVNNAIADIGTGEMFLPDRDFRVSSAPTNPTGVRMTGPGRLLLPETGGFQQLNSYGDTDILVGKEYLYRAYARLNNGPAGATAQLKIFVNGDSTVEGYVEAPASMDGRFLVQNLLPTLFQRRGLSNVSVTNRGVSGTSWADLNAIPDLAPATDLIIIKYGINDGAIGYSDSPQPSVSDRIAAMATAMRAKLAAIRAQTYGTLTNCAILLMGPNATNDSPHGRNEEWYEQVRNVYVKAARDYKCAFFDTYAYLRDARAGAGRWMDVADVLLDPTFNPNTAIHPLGIMNAWIWGGMMDTCFPQGEIAVWTANACVSIADNGGTNPATSKTPADYGYAMWTVELADAADGWPTTGLLVTLRNPDTYSKQWLYPLAATGRVYERFAASGSAWSTVWVGAKVALSGTNGWVSFGGTSAVAAAIRDAQGVVTVQGRIKSGTTTAGTTMVTLPVGYRPAEDHYFSCAGSGTTPVRVKVATTGDISCDSAGDATSTSISGISFIAA